MSHRQTTSDLRDAIQRAEQASRRAHNLALAEHAGLRLTLALGRSQSILMTWLKRSYR